MGQLKLRRGQSAGEGGVAGVSVSTGASPSGNPDIDTVRYFPDLSQIANTFCQRECSREELSDYAQECGCPLCNVGLAAVCMGSHDIEKCFCSSCAWGLEKLFPPVP